MGLNINTKLTNNLNGYLLDAKNVKGGYLVVADFSEFANLPAATMQNGMLAYCQSAVTIQEVYYQQGFYQYNGSVWNAVDFGRAYGDFNSGWRTNGTTIQFCDDINADITATTGMVYIGAATFSDFPSGISNAEVIVEIIPSSLNNCPKVIHLILTSGSIFPFRWEYTYWKVGTSNPSKTGWIGYQNALKAGNFVTLTNNSNDKTTTINMVPKADWDHNFFHCAINSTTFSDIYGAVKNDGQIPVALYPIIVEDPQTGEEIEVGNRIYMYECMVYDELQDAYYYKFACVDEGTIYYAVVGQDDQWTLSSVNIQSQLTFDNAPTDNSNNPVKSGGVYTALDNKLNKSTSTSVVYCVNNSGDQATIAMDSLDESTQPATYVYGYIPKRDGVTGDIKVPQTPKDDDYAVSKYYVDNSLSSVVMKKTFSQTPTLEYVYGQVADNYFLYAIPNTPDYATVHILRLGSSPYTYSVEAEAVTSGSRWTSSNLSGSTVLNHLFDATYAAPYALASELTTLSNTVANKQDKPVLETYTITSWTADANIAPFTYKATATATTTIGANTMVELLNDNAINFATYNFNIGEINGQIITFYSIGEPSSSVSLKVRIGG